MGVANVKFYENPSIESRGFVAYRQTEDMKLRPTNVKDRRKTRQRECLLSQFVCEYAVKGMIILC